MGKESENFGEQFYYIHRHKYMSPYWHIFICAHMYVYMCVSVCTRVYMDFVVHDYAYYTKTYSSYLKCFLKEKYISLESQNYGLLYTYMLHIYTNIYTHTYIYIYTCIGGQTGEWKKRCPTMELSLLWMHSQHGHYRPLEVENWVLRVKRLLMCTVQISIQCTNR